MAEKKETKQEEKREFKNIYEKLNYIQVNLKAPKGQYSEFGDYWYRSLENITDALKPFLKATGTILLMSDEIVLVNERYYVKATATIMDSENSLSVTALARETFTKKKMDDSQITGAASSYARKYALNGLFAIDDTKDADATNKHEETKTIKTTKQANVYKKPQRQVTNEQAKEKLTEIVGKFKKQFNYTENKQAIEAINKALEVDVNEIYSKGSVIEKIDLYKKIRGIIV
jgi:hypothetical protein